LWDKTSKGVQISNHSKHLSEWYSNKLSYPALMEEDYFIRTKSMHISKIFIDFKVEINRITQNENSQEYVNITIHALFRVQICHVKSQNILWIQQKIQIKNKCDFKQF
jgi:hypothetical protein